MPSKTTVFFFILVIQIVCLILWQMDVITPVSLRHKVASRPEENYKTVFGVYEPRDNATAGKTSMNSSRAMLPVNSSTSGYLIQTVHSIIERTKQVITRTVWDNVRRSRENATTTVLDGSATSIRSRPFAPVITEEVYLLVLIISRPSSRSRRDLLRRTWTSTLNSKNLKGLPGRSLNVTSNYRDLNIYCLFSVGFSGDVELDQRMENESFEYGDILRVDQKESYKNLVGKVQDSFKWALRVQPKYILKADDDVYVNFPRLLNWLHEPSIPEKLYAGFVHHRAFIHRNPSSKWYVSKKDFPEKYFPNYCAGPFYIFSGNILKDVHMESLKKPRFQVEDAYFGWLARSVGVTPLDMGGGTWAWEGNMNVWSDKWTDERLKKTAVFGDSLNDKEIKYFYERFKKIRQSR